ncbi:MAG: hypothetical protein WB812_02085 [Woeseiaceae bacterium]
MRYEASLNVRLYGTEEAPEAGRVVRSGALAVTLQGGNVRYVTIGGREAIRAIAFVVRDQDWRTYVPRISDLDVAARDDGFSIRYRAECSDGTQSLAYEAAIEGSPGGDLEFSVSAAASNPFLTNRAGFVVLHPLEGLAGRPIAVTHVDGDTERSTLPELVAPSQPFTDIRALCHDVAPGFSVTVRMEGDTYEMEDQRNWTDASYKTYIRPLSRPFPYTLEPGREIRQRVVVCNEGPLPAQAATRTDEAIGVRVSGQPAGTLPEFALAVHPEHMSTTLDATDLLRRTGVGHIVCTFDASLGHDADTMAQFGRIGKRTDSRLILEAVLPLQDAQGRYTDDAGVLASDIDTVRRCADDAGIDFDIVSPSPSCYHKSWQPSGPWPSAPPLRDVYAETRRAFPAARIAGGMHSYFTELNRRPPPADAVDLVTHSTCPVVHAADDRSIMETLQALPWVFRSARELAGGKPYWIGPTAIGMRFNPYGAVTTPNPDNVRAAMVTADPRQRGIFNAAWTLGYVTRAAAAGIAGLCLSAPTGPFGILWRKSGWRQPWFDDCGKQTAVFPVYHVIAGLARKAGATLRAVDCTDPAALAAIAIESRDGREVWLANLTVQKQIADLGSVASNPIVERLDAETFESCCAGPDGFAATASTMEGPRLTLDAYAVLRISGL